MEAITFFDARQIFPGGNESAVRRSCGRAAADQVTVCRSLDLNWIPLSICKPTCTVDHMHT